MLTAIVYNTNSGYTREYAELLAEKTGLPAYNIKNVIPPAARGKDVLFMSWLMAGGLQGYKKAQKIFNVVGACAVGMAPASQGQGEEMEKKTGISPMFYLQGGFDMNRLSGIYRFMMKVMCKKIMGDLSKVKEADWTEDQKGMYQMCTKGLNCVSEENLKDVLAWCEANK